MKLCMISTGFHSFSSSEDAASNMLSRFLAPMGDLNGFSSSSSNTCGNWIGENLLGGESSNRKAGWSPLKKKKK